MDFQAMTGLNGKISYDEKKIQLENILGFYGNSSLHLEGKIDGWEKSIPEFSLRLNLPAILKADLKGIPIFSDFNFSGPAQISMNINGTPENFKFEQQANLTRAGYKIPDLVQKKENVHNQFKAKGTLTEKGGLNIKNWVYELSGNKISGSMRNS